MDYGIDEFETYFENFKYKEKQKEIEIETKVGVKLVWDGTVHGQHVHRLKIGKIPAFIFV